MSFFSDCFGRSKKFRQIRNRRSSRPSNLRRPKLELQTLEDRAVPATFNLVGTDPSDSWNAIATWDNGSAFPNGTGDVANLNNTLTGPQAIPLGQAITVNQLIIGNTAGAGNSYTIGGDGTNALTLAGTSPQITSTSSNANTIAAKISLGAGTIISNNGTGTLSLANVISGSGGITIPSGSTGVIAITGGNSFTGGSTLTGPVALAGGRTPLGTGRSVTLSNARPCVDRGRRSGRDQTRKRQQPDPHGLAAGEPADRSGHHHTQRRDRERRQSHSGPHFQLSFLEPQYAVQLRRLPLRFRIEPRHVLLRGGHRRQRLSRNRRHRSLLNDTSYNTPTEGSIQLSPGWHTIDARGTNGGGGAGPSAQNNAGWTGWTNNLGLIYATTAVGATAPPLNASASVWSTITDPGNGSFLFEPNSQINNTVTLIGSNSVNVGVQTMPNSSTTYTVTASLDGKRGDRRHRRASTKTGVGQLLSSTTPTPTAASPPSTAELAISQVTNGFSPNSAFTVGSGGTLSLNGINATIAGINGSGTINNGSTANAVLTFAGSGSNTFSGNFVNGGTGTLSIVEAESGNQFFTGLSTTALSVTSGTVGGGNATGTGGSIGALSMTGGTLDAGLGGTTTAIFNTGNLTMLNGSALTVDAATTTPGSGYDQINVTGNVALGNGTLFPALNFNPTGNFSGGGSFVIINNTGTGTVTGHFAGLPEGAGIVVAGVTYSITYAGGANFNSVIISMVTPPPTVYVNDDWASYTMGQVIADVDSVTPGNQPGTFGESVAGSAVGFATINDAINYSQGQVAPAVSARSSSTAESTRRPPTAPSAIPRTLPLFQSGSTSSSDFSNDSGPVTVASLTTVSPATSIVLNNGVNLIVGTNNGTRVIASSIIGNGSLTKAGSGKLTLTTTDTYTGATTVNAGTLIQSFAGAIPNTPLIVNAGTVDLHGIPTTVTELSGTGAGTITSSVAGAITLTVGDGTNQSYAGIITNGTGTIALTKNGSGVESLSGTNTYTGTTTISAGTLQLGAAGVLAATDNVTIAGGANFIINGNQTLASVSGAGNITLASGILTEGGGNASTTESGTISGPGGITKTGSGVLTLSGNNSYQGATIISAGTVVMGNANALGSFSGGSATTIQSGATLDINGFAVDPTEVLSVAGTIQNTGRADRRDRDAGRRQRFRHLRRQRASRRPQHRLDHRLHPQQQPGNPVRPHQDRLGGSRRQCGQRSGPAQRRRQFRQVHLRRQQRRRPGHRRRNGRCRRDSRFLLRHRRQHQRQEHRPKRYPARRRRRRHEQRPRRRLKHFDPLRLADDSVELPASPSPTRR